jgi:dihydrofolate reductase
MSTIVPRICLIAARGRNNVIGVSGDLPWRLSSDLKLFKALTRGKPVVMGRKTWESLPLKPLPGRLNIVVTGQAGYHAQGAQVVGDFGEAFDAAFMQANTDRVDEVFVIGGAAVYAATLPLADRLYLSEVDAAPDGHVFFPEFDEADWSEIGREAYPAGPSDDHDFVFRGLERKR